MDMQGQAEVVEVVVVVTHWIAYPCRAQRGEWVKHRCVHLTCR